MNGSDERGPWYLLTGLILGLALGLAYAWTVQPVRYTDTTPESLRKEFKDQYRGLIASAYLGNADLQRARARLELLGDDDLFRALTEQAQRTMAENGSDRQAQALGILAIALGQAPPGPGQVVTQPGEQPTRLSPADPSPTSGLPAPPLVENTPASLPTRTPIPATQTPEPENTADTGSMAAASTGSPPPVTPSPTATFTLVPARTAASSGPFILLSQEKICDETLAEPVFRIEALDRFNAPVSGVPVIISWAEGEERFFTGLKPEKGLGYADFDLQPGVLYTIRLGDGGTPVTDVAAVMCPRASGPPIWGAWLLRFVQP